MQIRKANKNDLLEVSFLWVRLMAHIYPEETPSVQKWISKTESLMDNADYAMFIVEKGGKIIGFQDCVIVDDAVVNGLCALGMHVFVEPEYRSSAVGLMLFEEHEAWRKPFKVKSVKVMCVPRSSRMYEMLGFRPAETVLTKQIGD